MNRLTRTRTGSPLMFATMVILLMGTGLGTLTGCSSSGDTRVEVQATPQGKEEPTQQTSVLLNHTQSPMYQQMLRQGNYSDAAILDNFQHIRPSQSRTSSLFTNISAPSLAQASRNPSMNRARSLRPIPRLSANWHTRVGWTLVLDGNYRGAEAAYRQALRKNAKSAKAYLGLGMALSLQGNQQKAISAYKKAITIQPNYAAALVHLGYAYTKENTNNQDIAKARTLFKKASKLGDPFAMLALLDIPAQKESA